MPPARRPDVSRRMNPPLDHRAQLSARPVSPLRLPRGNRDGITQVDGPTVRRLIHRDGRPVVLTLGAPGDGTVRMLAAASRDDDARFGLERARFWSGVDDDLTGFLDRFAGDPVIGASVRSAPWLRPYRRPVPFQVLMTAVCEQLITDERARAITAAITRTFGPRYAGLTDAPAAATIAGLAPAQLEACGLAAKRARTLITAGREVAAGRVELLDPEAQEDGWRRLRTIPGIGPWTTSSLALHGQGRLDALPAGDHAYRTTVARLLGRPPGAKASEQEVIAFFERFSGWRGVAGWHLLRTVNRIPGSGARAPRSARPRADGP